MTGQTNAGRKTLSIFRLVKLSLTSHDQDFTTGSIRRAVFLLAIPMVLEMCMESVFAIVDIFFVSKLGADAAATVGLTETVLTIIYSIAIGLSMAATAMVSRRVGEKNFGEAARSGMQAILLALVVVIIISVAGVVYARDILVAIGAPATVLAIGVPYAQIMFGGCVVIILLFLINGIFRGAGNAGVAMRSLWIANICNIVLCPLLIYGIGPFDGYGLTGAAIATTIGRGTGVLYQLYHLFSGKHILKMKVQYLWPDWSVQRSLLNVSSTATLQFLVASASWIFLAHIIAGFGSTAIAGYTIALRILMFFLLPAWGLSNAAATLTGQNLGAGKPDRAEASVWKTAQYNMLLMAMVTLLLLFFGDAIVSLIPTEPLVVAIATEALRIISLGYVAYGMGMVLMNAFNGAGDSRTPTWINLFGFWAFQIPLAYTLATYFALGVTGVFFAILVAESAIALVAYIIFKKGNWKLVKI